MNPRVHTVKPLADHRLELHFADGQVRDPAVFGTAHAALGTVVRDNGADLCPDTLYLGSEDLWRKAG